MTSTSPAARVLGIVADGESASTCIYDDGGCDGGTYIGCRGVNGTGWASKIDSNKVSLYAFAAEDCETRLNVRGDKCLVAGFYGNGNSTDLRIDGNDCNIVNPISPSLLSIADNGTRTRWDDVIGGGPLGGVDLGSTTGQFVGDEAMADGTTSTAQLHARWTGSTWQPSDGSATITPA